MKRFLILITLLFATTAQAGVFAKGELLTADKLNAVDATVVHKTGNETVGGAKTFTSTIIGNISGNAATTSDSTAVRLTGAQTVTGFKNFSGAGIKVSDLIAKGPWVDVRAYGAISGGVTPNNVALSSAFTVNPNARILIPSGDWLINNDAGPLTITNFNGELVFSGKARLLFSDNTKAGIVFSGGTGAVLRGLRISYATPPSVRTNAQEAITITGTTDTLVDGAYIENSPAAGLLFRECIRPKARSVVIVSSKADGLHFANCQDPSVIGLVTADTGDDGLAFVNYASGTNNTGGVATNIRIRNSEARGIAVVGQSDVVIDNFEVDGTSASGIYTAYESAYSTRVPAHVVWSNGLVKNAGTVSPLVGNQFGIEYSGITSVKYSNIKVVASANRGMSGAAASGMVEIDNVIVDSPATSNGFNLSALTLLANNLKSINTQSYGIYVANCGSVMVSNLKAVNAAITDALHRAVWFSANTRILVDGVSVVDTQGTATGYIVGTDGGSQAGVVTNIQSSLANGTFSVSDGSYPAVQIGTVNGTYANNTLTTVSGTPWYKGQFAIVGSTVYFAIGTSSSADWKALN